MSTARLGLRNAPQALLAEARERTRGYPRALEHLFGILSADRDTTLKGLLDDTKQFLPEQVVEVLVGEAFSRLDTTAQLVMQSLATYRYPVIPAAVDYLLQPYATGLASGRVLSRLVNMQFVRRDAGRYYLHQVDRDYALSRIPEGEPGDGNEEVAAFYSVCPSPPGGRVVQIISQTTRRLEIARGLDGATLRVRPALRSRGLRYRCSPPPRIRFRISVLVGPLPGNDRAARAPAGEDHRSRARAEQRGRPRLGVLSNGTTSSRRSVATKRRCAWHERTKIAGAKGPGLATLALA